MYDFGDHCIEINILLEYWLHKLLKLVLPNSKNYFTEHWKHGSTGNKYYVTASRAVLGVWAFCTNGSHL